MTWTQGKGNTVRFIYYCKVTTDYINSVAMYGRTSALEIINTVERLQNAADHLQVGFIGETQSERRFPRLTTPLERGLVLILLFGLSLVVWNLRTISSQAGLALLFFLC